MALSNIKRNSNASSTDFYITPVEALDAIFSHKEAPTISGPLLDPCAGSHALSKYVSKLGYSVITNELHTNDVFDYDLQYDFLSDAFPKGVYGTVIMNPPYKKTLEFVDKALEISDTILMFNRLTTLEGKARGSRYTSGEWPLKAAYICKGRVSCDEGMYKDGEFITKKSPNAVAYAWYWLDNEYQGEPVVRWLDT